jgi:hypothetical protein
MRTWHIRNNTHIKAWCILHPPRWALVTPSQVQTRSSVEYPAWRGASALFPYVVCLCQCYLWFSGGIAVIPSRGGGRESHKTIQPKTDLLCSQLCAKRIEILIHQIIFECCLIRSTTTGQCLTVAVLSTCSLGYERQCADSCKKQINLASHH